MVPIQELKNGGYEGLNNEARLEKIKTDFENFISKRAKYVVQAVNDLSEGKEISANDIINEIENQ